MLQSQAGAQVPLYNCGGHSQLSCMLSQLACQGLLTMFQSQAGVHVPPDSCGHCYAQQPCSSLRLVPKCLLTAVVTASSAACFLS